MTDQRSVVVIIVNYRTSHLMEKLLSTIREDHLDLKIFILDNASTEETLRPLLKLNDSRTQVLSVEKNLGFTGGLNYVLKHAMKHLDPFKYFFLLNPDAFSEPGMIGRLCDILEVENEAACVSPQILYMNGTPWYTGANVNFSSGRVNNTPVRKSNDSRQYYEVDAFSGCAALFRLDYVINAGMFNEGLFMYYDEVELSMKLKKLGYRILYAPGLTMFHDVSYTTRNISHLKSYYMTRNKLSVFNETMTLRSKIYYVLFMLAYYIKNRRFKNARYHLKGMVDYKKGRNGGLTISS